MLDFIVKRESASGGTRHSETGKEIPAGHVCLRLFRLCAVSDGNLADPERHPRHQVREHTLLLPQCLVDLHAHRGVPVAGLAAGKAGGAQVDELLRVTNGKGAQQYGIHHAEETAVFAPMPRASVTIATTEKPGVFRN